MFPDVDVDVDDGASRLPDVNVRRLSPRRQLRMKVRPQSTEDQMLMRWNFAVDVVLLLFSVALPCWGFSFVVEIVFP